MSQWTHGDSKSAHPPTVVALANWGRRRLCLRAIAVVYTRPTAVVCARALLLLLDARLQELYLNTGGLVGAVTGIEGTGQLVTGASPGADGTEQVKDCMAPTNQCSE